MKRPLAYITAPWSNNQYENAENAATYCCLLYTSSRDLKRRGMTFVGTVIVYAYLQAVGVIWSHEEGCFLEHRPGF